MKVVIIDNFDSFSFNLYQRVAALGAEVQVFRNDQLSLSQLKLLHPEALIFSPGPGHPEDRRRVGLCFEALKFLSPTVPTLGVCLGHQLIGAYFGLKIERSPRPVHGQASLIHHEGHRLFEGLPHPFWAMRYHSLSVQKPAETHELEVIALGPEDLVMGLAHRSWPLWGVQFHPESIGTPQGSQILDNFLGLAQERLTASL